MTVFGAKYSNRLIIGSVSSVALHCLLFVVLALIVNISLFNETEYPETIVVSFDADESLVVRNTMSASRTERTEDAEERNARMETSESSLVNEKNNATTKSDNRETGKSSDNKSAKGSDIPSDADNAEKQNDSRAEDGKKPEPTARKSALDEGNLAGLDRLLGSDTGASGDSSSKTDTGGKDTSGTARKGSSSSIEWEDSRERSALNIPQPKIPAWVEKQGLRLQATFTFVLTADGFLANIKAVRSTGYTEVDNALHDALRQYRFEPRKDAKNVSGKIAFAIEYR